MIGIGVKLNGPPVFDFSNNPTGVGTIMGANPVDKLSWHNIAPMKIGVTYQVSSVKSAGQPVS
jgi:hypothetical protein